MSIGGDIADEFWRDYIGRMLAGTGCANLKELRLKCDWAMDMATNNIYAHTFDGCNYCHKVFPDTGELTHEEDCEYVKNYYYARLPEVKS